MGHVLGLCMFILFVIWVNQPRFPKVAKKMAVDPDPNTYMDRVRHDRYISELIPKVIFWACVGGFLVFALIDQFNQ